MAFTETQKFDQFWFKVAYAIAGFLGTAATAAAIIKSGKYIELLIVLGMLLFLALIYFLVFEAEAQTRIDTVGISYTYWPLVRKWKTIPWKNIEKLELKKIYPIAEYGGWGYRFGRQGKGIILNDYALIITLKKGKPFAISTNKSKQMRAEIEFRNAELIQ